MGRRADNHDDDYVDEDDALLELASTPWQREFTRRFLKVERQQQTQTDLMRAGKLGFALLSAISGTVASVISLWYYVAHLRT